jgi:hypothetical protein
MKRTDNGDAGAERPLTDGGYVPPAVVAVSALKPLLAGGSGSVDDGSGDPDPTASRQPG